MLQVGERVSHCPKAPVGMLCAEQVHNNSANPWCQICQFPDSAEAFTCLPTLSGTLDKDCEISLLIWSENNLPFIRRRGCWVQDKWPWCCFQLRALLAYRSELSGSLHRIFCYNLILFNFWKRKTPTARANRQNCSVPAVFYVTTKCQLSGHMHMQYIQSLVWDSLVCIGGPELLIFPGFCFFFKKRGWRWMYVQMYGDWFILEDSEANILSWLKRTEGVHRRPQCISEVCNLPLRVQMLEILESFQI